MNRRRVYLYSIRDGELHHRLGTFEDFSPNRGVFHGDDGRKIYCSRFGGHVEYATVWFPERNDSLAVELLINYEQNQIRALNKRIYNHQQTIARLRKGVKDGSN